VLTPPLEREHEDGLVGGLPLVAWVQIVAVTVLMAALFRFNLVRLWGKTNPFNGQDSNWQHAVIVPLIGIYYLFIHREELLRAAAMPRVREGSIRILAALGMLLMVAAGAMFLRSGETGTPLALVGTLLAGLAVAAIVPTSTTFGTVLLFEGLLVFAYGIFPGQNDYIKDLGMVITIFGAATLLAGWPVMKIAWFPIVFLVVALPWPELVYSKLAWPLQKLAASAAVGTLRACGVQAQNFGTKITMFDRAGLPRSLNVAEACAGLKSVMTFLTVGATVAFLSQRALWEKLVITASAVPIAIFCNVVRVCGQGLLDRYGSHEWSEGFAHQFTGLVMVIPGIFLVLLVGWILDQMFIEEVEPGAAATARGGGGTAAAATAAVAAGNRSKRMIVEVPRKKLAGSGGGSAIEAAPVSEDSGVEVATPGVPVTGSEVTLPAVGAPRCAAGAAGVPGAKPQAAGPVATSRQSTLKAPTSAVPARAGAGDGGAGGSTLKPSAKPAAPRAPITPPAGGLKPSTLKPSAPKPPAAPPPTRLKPPATGGAGTAARPGAAPQQNVPGARQPSSSSPAGPAKPKAPAGGAGGVTPVRPPTREGGGSTGTTNTGEGHQ
jgi:exosortase